MLLNPPPPPPPPPKKKGEIVTNFEKLQRDSNIYCMAALISIFTCQRYIQPHQDSLHNEPRPPKYAS